MPNLRRIMLVDDESDIGSVTKLTLEAIGGFEVIVCRSGIEALRQAPLCLPDLILLDVMMPGMDGLMTFKALRELPALAHVPVVFVTAKAQQHEIRQYVALGALGVIAKPFDPLKLPAQIQALWSQH